MHFGIRSNSISWLEMQKKFFNEVIIQTIESEFFDRIIFLGDLTDIRYAINQQIGYELKNLVRKLSSRFADKNPEGKIVFIAGNHDYYSPVEDFSQINSYEVLFGEEFASVYDNIIFVTQFPYFDEDNEALYLPWFYTDDNKKFSDALYSYKGIKQIYCHTDLEKWGEGRIYALKGAKVYSGHIHYGWINEDNKLYNLTASCSFNFNDVNAKRYIYVINNGDIVRQIENKITPTFKRLYNLQIFENLKEEFFDNAYVQLMIDRKNINKAEYIERIKDIKKQYGESFNISIKVYDAELIQEQLDITPIQTNIDEYIDNNVPLHLELKYKTIKEKLRAENSSDF
jgi:hypothetical protein